MKTVGGYNREHQISVCESALMSDVTPILQSIEKGDPPAAEQLLPLVYDELHRKNPRHAELVKLRFFAGLTQQQAADTLGIVRSTTDLDWA